jgi:hypothetical protein
VPAGGTADQVLAKIDGTNFNTQWVTNSATPVWSDGFPTYDPRYVNVAGDTMTNPLIIQPAAGTGSEYLALKGSAGLYAYIGFYESTVRKGWIGKHTAGDMYVNADTNNLYLAASAGDVHLRALGASMIHLRADTADQMTIDNSYVKIPTNILQLQLPGDFWSQGTGFIAVPGLGNISTQGSNRVSICSNGYRTASGWANLGAGGNNGAAIVDVDPIGAVLFRCQTTTPSSNAGPPESARINQNAFLVGKTSYNTYTTTSGFEVWNADGQFFSTLTTSTFNAIVHLSAADANGIGYLRFYRTGATILGSINQVSTTGVVYNTTSDKRLKEFTRNFDDDEALDIIRAIAPVHYTWIGNPDTSEKIGFFAQDLFLVAPEAVTAGEGEPGDEDFVPWGVDYGRLTPRIIAAIQALDRRLTDLEH